MTFIASLWQSMPSTVSLGLLWGVMTLGLFLTYRILDFADLTVDGSFALGGAVAAQLVVSGGYHVAMPNLLDGEKRDQKVVVSVRPEEFIISRDGEGIEATVVSSTFLGLNMHYFLKLDDGTDVQVIQEAELDSRLKDGEKIRLGVKQNKINIFCEDGSRNLVRGVTNDNVQEA